ncbi:MAG: crotonase/enoyl-CoA hydratase family protein [Acidobacteriota bacterium]|nr:crotonase/enoyl-CoA hydratase family protein [Acidobacteriota bacterium]
MTTQTEESRISIEQRGQILLIGLNRPAKRNAFDRQMLDELATAYAQLEDIEEVRCGVLFAEGEMFTAGLDLASLAPTIATSGNLEYPENSIDPLNLYGTRTRTKPMVAAVQGKCLTVGIELLLATDVRIASENATFAQIEIKRGIFPFGGATLRFPEIAGWGNAMRWLLTGDEFDAAEALRIGLVQEVVAHGKQIDKAVEIAERIAAQAPLGVRATIKSARKLQREGFDAAAQDLMPQVAKLFQTEDAREGVQSFIERRDGNFTGR